MTFLVVVKMREDGDGDALCAFANEDDSRPLEWALQTLEYFRDTCEGDEFMLAHLENVTDVIEGEYLENSDCEESAVRLFERGENVLYL